MNVQTNNRGRQLEPVTRFSVQHLNFLKALKEEAYKKKASPAERKTAEENYISCFKDSMHAAAGIKAVQQLMPLSPNKKLGRELRSKARKLKEANSATVLPQAIPVPQTVPSFAGVPYDA